MKSDAQVQADVVAELNSAPLADATQIVVDVNEGIVTLEGHVNSDWEKRNAECTAKLMLDAKAQNVAQNFRVPKLSKGRDMNIARSAKCLLQWATALPENQIEVVVENGWLTVSGMADWSYQRDAVERAMHYLVGVAGISNNIAIKPHVSMSVVKSDIDDALKQHVGADGKNISVEVHGSVVTLSGTVDSWPERELATHCVWDTPGVQNVVDNISVAY